MKELAIEVDGLSVCYSLQKQRSIRDVFKRKKKIESFTALDDISFKVDRGDILGIVGKNGSGKSTLLKAIGGIFSADSGSINLFGNKVSLLSIGVGFISKLTGRENVILSGLLTGYSRDEIDKRMENIIEFSEIGAFIDYPVATYSSGMYSKLAFSLATELNTDIILVDEVLSVGDEHFAKKSYLRMKELIQDANHTVVIVSHNIQTLEELCTQVLWIHEGKMKEIGDTKNVLEHYQRFMDR